jgi:hypothetical protein
MRSVSSGITFESRIPQVYCFVGTSTRVFGVLGAPVVSDGSGREARRCTLCPEVGRSDSRGDFAPGDPCPASQLGRFMPVLTGDRNTRSRRGGERLSAEDNFPACDRRTQPAGTSGAQQRGNPAKAGSHGRANPTGERVRLKPDATYAYLTYEAICSQTLRGESPRRPDNPSWRWRRRCLRPS